MVMVLEKGDLHFWKVLTLFLPKQKVHLTTSGYRSPLVCLGPLKSSR